MHRNRKKVTVEGNKPTSGRIVIKDGQVQTTSTMIIGDYEISYNDKEKDYVMKKLYKGILCTAKTEVTTGNVPSVNYAYGDEYTCELGDNDSKTSFVLETNGDNVSLIMDKNIDSNGKGTTSGNTVAWVSKEDYLAAGGEDLSNDGGSCQYVDVCTTNEYGPITALEYLKNSTKNRTKLTEFQINLPTGQQIAIAGGDNAWTDSNVTYSKLSTWLIGNISGLPSSYGYWTSTPNTNYSNYVWFVSFESKGTLIYNSELFVIGVDNGDNVGIRPVITISKSQLN